MVVVVDGKEVLTDLTEVLDPRHTALLIIDVQNDFCSPGGLCDQSGQSVALMPPMIANIARLLEAARLAGVRPIYLQNTNFADRRSASPAHIRFHALKRGYGWDQESTVLDTWGWRFVDEIAPRPGDFVIQKHRSIGFIGTDLDLMLRSNMIKSVLVAGTATHGCVDGTARVAEGLDYYVVVAEDGCASFQKEQHEAAILCLAARMEIVRTSAIVRIWKSAPTTMRS